MCTPHTIPHTLNTLDWPVHYSVQEWQVLQWMVCAAASFCTLQIKASSPPAKLTVPAEVQNLENTCIPYSQIFLFAIYFHTFCMFTYCMKSAFIEFFPACNQVHIWHCWYAVEFSCVQKFIHVITFLVCKIICMCDPWRRNAWSRQCIVLDSIAQGWKLFPEAMEKWLSIVVNLACLTMGSAAQCVVKWFFYCVHVIAMMD